jgi:hypothetical protein
VVRCTFSPARAWRPAVVARLARTLGLTQIPRMRSIVVAAIIGSACLISTGAVVHSFESLIAEPQAFSKEAWQRHRLDIESSNDPGCVLGGLTQDILNKERLSGKSKQYVLDQLGPPDRREASSLVYSIGQCHGWGWHHSELVVRLSATGFVRGAEPRRTQ